MKAVKNVLTSYIKVGIYLYNTANSSACRNIFKL